MSNFMQIYCYDTESYILLISMRIPINGTSRYRELRKQPCQKVLSYEDNLNANLIVL